MFSERSDSRNNVTVLHINDDGFLDFGLCDPGNPRNWSKSRKWYTTCCTVFLATTGNIVSSIPSGCLKYISHDFQVSQQAAGLTITLYLLGYCTGPFLFAPLSELYGRRPIFRLSFSTFLLFNFLCAFATNFGTLLGGRFLAGTSVSAALCNAPGVLADLWDDMERGNPMAVFSASVWAGPSLGPIISGFLVLGRNWRWGLYVALCLAGAATLFMLTVPETNGAVILLQRARRIRKAKIQGYENVRTEYEGANMTLFGIYKTALTRPWALLLDPISFLCAVYMAMVFTLQFMLFTMYPIVFQEMRGWNEGIGQLPLLGTVVGSVAGAIIICLDTERRKNKLQAGYSLEPEDRLIMGMVGGVGFAVTMFWFSWTAHWVHWSVPTIAGAFLSAALVLTMVSYLNYLVDSYAHYAASAMAVNTFARSLGSASAPLFTASMFHTLGIGSGGSLIGGVASILAVVPFVFCRYGEAIRCRSKYTALQTAVNPDPEEQPRSSVDDLIEV
ncbi:Major facilitator superfamily domain, general substrate transporter [Metarhizium album ARSEF 1941]|uniref:Major facilitator superfamily domain, general substrate transporter n=1 Tax=Metarhizium album (strain ARSEF 1941) TaxID=1081103 RepID=A0A0B2WX23_METAS|nr:Major facilitator superfamily domain, general substrate transporter [Metarhizium album ARSEF 1941]KHN97425.1 Major facilitator superfamily domain, general substrate transporter [Metarhizium album ARSEF 1941]